MIPPAAIVSRYHALDSSKDVLLPSLAKIPMVLVATLVVLLPLYRDGVRPTFVGALVNGQKYPARSHLWSRLPTKA